MTPDIAVIVVNWNTQNELRHCLRSLLDAPHGDASVDVFVADNASADGSASMVRDEFPAVHLIVNAENLGFVRANNAIINQTKSRFVFLLNSDAFVHGDALQKLLQFADAHPDIGIVGPKVLNPDGTLQMSCRRFPTLGAGFFRNTLLGRFFPTNKYAADYLMSDFDHQTVKDVDWVSGCAMFIRRDLLDEIGPFDERFVAYCEDVDLCQRTWEAGKHVTYFPDALVTHAIGRSSDKNAEAMIREFHKSWYEFDKKRHPNSGPLRKLAVKAGLNLRAAVRIARRRLAERKRK